MARKLKMDSDNLNIYYLSNYFDGWSVYHMSLDAGWHCIDGVAVYAGLMKCRCIIITLYWLDVWYYVLRKRLQ